MARAFHEIMSTRFWDFYPESLHAYRRTILDNIASRRPYEKPEERNDRPYFLSSRDGFKEKTYVGNYDRITYGYDLEEDDRIISVIDVQGPILRNGDLCSYGSKEHKDIIMRASDDAHTIGFIIEMDSPGGSAMAKFDYEMALNYARSKGKKIVGHIDGMACSAGYALMALCDEIYFTNPHDTVGCIGTMCAMFTNKDGDVNTITQERYAEIYADGSPYKNKEYRDAAEGNYDGIKEELNKLCADFQQMVREHRPKVTDDQLTGKTFEAGDVEGTMVDGQGDFNFCINRVQQLAGVSQKPRGSSSGTSRENRNPESIKEEKQPDTQGTASAEQPASDKPESQTKKQATMAKSYPFIQSAAQVNSLVVEENGGFYMVETMADNVEAFVMKAKQTESTLAAKLTEVEQLNATIEQMKKDHAEALTNLKSEHEKEISSLKDAHEKEISSLKETQKKESENLSSKLAEAEKSIEQKDEEIKELSETAQQAPTPQDPPKDNNGGQESGQFQVKSVCGENMSWAEKAEARRQRDAEISKAR